jgi:nucleoid-associated protein YgaU
VLQQHPEPSFQVQGDAVIKKVTGNFEGFQGMGARLDLDEPVRLAGGTPPAPSQSQPQTQPQTQAQPQAQAQPQPDPDSGQQHTYQEGETFYSLAEQYYGDGEQWPRIRDANPELDPDNLEAGQVITIP